MRITSTCLVSVLQDAFEVGTVAAEVGWQLQGGCLVVDVAVVPPLPALLRSRGLLEDALVEARLVQRRLLRAQSKAANAKLAPTLQLVCVGWTTQTQTTSSLPTL